jgi:hypothetical protein
MADAHPPAGGGGGGGSKLGMMWGVAILVIVLVFTNVLGMLSGQLNSFLQVIKLNLGPILIIAAIIWISRAAKG